MKKLVLSIASVLFVFGVAVAQLPERIVCAGDYGGHLQGVATDGESIYWSFTVAVVKTDLTGNILVSREAPSHQGDMCYKDGVVYVAVNRGRFNTESRGVSQVTAYDAKTLEPMWTKQLPDMPHGAGGMTWKDDRFYIIGGLPLKHEKNYVYEYTSDFKFVKRHDLDTGFTWMGIQTAAHEDDTFYFGIYGSKGYLGGTGRDKATKRNTGYLVRQKAFPDPKKAFALARTNKGELRLFFEGRDASGWKDAGYVFNNDGNKPIFSQDALFVPVRGAAKRKEFPAVGIGGGKEFYTPDLVRGVHRAALQGEVFSLHVPGTPDSLNGDAALAAAVEAVTSEAVRLGIKIVGR